MCSFFALLLKEFTLRRKSCCAIVVNLILPLGLIVLQIIWRWLFPNSTHFLIAPVEDDLLAQNTDIDIQCPDYSKGFQAKYYVVGLQMNGTFDSGSQCSFEATRCAEGIKWDKYLFEEVSDVQELTQATRSKTLTDLCRMVETDTIGECNDTGQANLGLHMNYANDALDLTYFIGHEADLTKEEDFKVSLQLFHFAVMAKAYLQIVKKDHENPPYVLLNISKEQEKTEGPNEEMDRLKFRTGHSYVTFNTMTSLIVLVRHILYEKGRKMKDLMHMSGVGNLSYYGSYIVFDVVILLVFNFLQLLCNTYASLEYYMVTATYSLAVTLFAIAFTVFFTRETLCLLLFTLIVAFDIIRSNLLMEAYLLDHVFRKIPDYVQLLMALYPSYGLKIGFDQLDNRRNRNHLQLFKFDWDKNPAFLQPAFILFAMIFSCILYTFVIFYIGEVCPWQSGTPRSLLFPLAKLIRSRKCAKLESDKNAGSPEFEPEPNVLKVGIEVNSLKKRYGFTKMVLKGVFLKVFHGQISVLLGHNGAGKTTLMNIITGLDSATSGKVLINGVDVDYEPTKARRGIGFCPQTNIQYDTLSVWHHLKFFGMLKGFPIRELNQEILRVLNLVKLTEVQDFNSTELSGGMKRRLQLGMAFIGGSRVLILDEPSSGLDVEARRVVWDMLLAVKREYLIFMTTHHMEEADCLGDRVIIMHDGEIRCVGSPMFLKRVFGVGLTLRVSKSDTFQSKACFDFIRQYLKSATLTKETQFEVLYLFAKSDEPNLPQFFKDLDPIRSKLGITSCSVAITTMDDVFVRVGEKYDAKKGADLNGSSLLTIEPGQKPLKATFCQTFFALLVKRFHVTKRSTLFHITMVLSCLFSILFGLFFLKSSYRLIDGYNDSFDLNDKYGYTCLPEDNPVCKSTFSDSVLDKSKEIAFTIEVKNNPDSRYYSCLLLTPQKGQELAAITETFQMLINAHLTSNSKIDVNARISVTKPRMAFYSDVNYQVAPPLIISWSGLILLIPLRAVLAEKRTKVKLLQLMTGVSPVVYWLAHFLSDYLLSLVISLPMLVLLPVFYFAFGHLVFNEISIAALYYFGFFYFIFSSILWSYMVTTLPLGPTVGLQILMYYCFLGYCPGQGLLVFAMTQEKLNNLYQGFVIIYWLLRISPISQFEQILVSVFDLSDKSAFCKHLFEAFGRDEICNGQSWTKLSNHCCNGMDSVEPWKHILKAKNWILKLGEEASKKLGNKHESFVVPLILAQMILGLFILLILALEYLNIANKKRTSNVRHGLGQEDLDVLNERMATEKVLAENGQINKAMLIKDLTKKYGKKFVVNRLTVTVEKNQIFGFLGVNGAGKSTAFKMMVGEINRTGGEAYIGQYSLSRNFQTYRAQIGYCPQFDAFVTGLTGTEMLYLFARLRGICKSQLKQTVDQMIKLVDLQDYARVVADNYSGGNKRKLSAAMALIGYPKVIFLDEPTAAVDPVARRKIWKVMEYAKQATGSSIVLTSHALDECEALCEKIVVMVAGQLKCLGSLQHLKQKFGQGLHITAKTKPGYENLSQVQEAIRRVVPSARVVDSHTNVTILHVTDPQVQIGDVYGAMEQIRAQFDLEDYQVEETNLEQIFLYFAKAAYSME